MKLRQLWSALTAAALLLCAGCAASTGGTTEPSDPSEQTFEIEVTPAVQEILDRGYLTVACKDDVPGFSYYNEETGAYEGGEIDLAYYIAAKLFDTSYEEAVERELVRFQTVATADRETVLTDGEVDYVIATYTITEERAEQVDFSNSYYTSAIGLMVNKTATDANSLREARIRSVSDLDGKTIGVISNSTTRSDFMRYLQRNSISIVPKFSEYPTYDALSKALSQGSIDVFSVDVTILKGYLTNSRKILSDRFAPQKYGVAAQKDRDGLIQAVNTVIDELEYNQIVLFS
ncbi:MAG: transporter substrate-binding domain-containing protein [Butyricicoccus sp.]